MAGKLSKDYADNPQAAIRALMKCTTPDEVEAFMVGDKRKSIQKEAFALISRMNHVSDLPEMQIDNPPAQVVAVGAEGEQPLDNTSAPRDKKAAKAVREQAAAGRPHKKNVAGINPPSSRERLLDRNMQVAAEANTQFNNAMSEEIDEIMEWRDRADKIAGQEDKFTFALPVKLSIVRDGADFAIKVRLTPGAKQKIEREGSVHIANPDGDLVDRANAAQE